MSELNISNPALSVKLLEHSSMSISDYMVAFSGQTNSYCVGVIDMVDSTKITVSLSVGKMSRYYQIFLNTMADTLNKFGGRVIKNIGDSLLFFFPASSKGRKYGFMSCLEGCLEMVEIHDHLCACAKNEGLPCINYRISCDYGAVVLMQSKDSSLDMIGPPLNMCSKINHFAQNNQIVIGADLYEMVKKMNDYHFTLVKSYDTGQKFQYPIYAVTRR
jgi:class 3 adenylate cyclase